MIVCRVKDGQLVQEGSVRVVDGGVVFDIQNPRLLRTLQGKGPIENPDEFMSYLKGRFAMSSTIILKEEEEGKKGLGELFKYGTAQSGHWGHRGGEGGVGNPGGSSSDGGGGTSTEARDARIAERHGMEMTRLDKKGQRVMEDGTPMPKHIREGLSQPIPPNWKNVYINPDPKSCREGVYAVRGRDAAGRVQALYTKEYRGGKAEEKFSRVKELDGKFQSVIKENEKNLKGTNAENASVLRLIMATGIRPGSDADTRAAKQAYGASTLLGKHVYKTRDGVELRFVGKKGVEITAKVMDQAVVKDLLARAAKVGKAGRLFDTDYKSLWSYSKSLDGKGFLPKDFRTLTGTRLAAEQIKKVKAPTNEKEYKRAVKEVATVVSQKLGNTPTIALQSYINPAVWGMWRGNWGGKKKQVGILVVLKGGKNEITG